MDTVPSPLNDQCDGTVPSPWKVQGDGLRSWSLENRETPKEKHRQCVSNITASL
jgi:hypothetical protein